MNRFDFPGWSVPLIASLFPSLCGAESAGESPRIAALRAATAQEQAVAVEGFWRALERDGTPIVEAIEGSPAQARVTFVLRAESADEESNAGLIGSFVPGGSRELARFERVPGTDVLQKSFIVDARSRYRYYLAWPQGRAQDAQAIAGLALNGLTYELFADSRSRLFYSDEDGGRLLRTSYFDGPAASAEPWLAASSDVAHGLVETMEVASRTLGNSRKVSLYTPAGYRPDGSGYPLLLLFDREAYLEAVPTATILDNLIAAGAIPSLVAVLVSAIDEGHRSDELRPNPEFAAFVIDELLPRVRRMRRISRDPRLAIVGGSSLGGLASTYIAQLHPETFGNVLSMSGSYWWYPDESEKDDVAVAQARSGWLPRQLAARDRLPVRFYVAVGLGEGEGMLTPNRLFRDVLTSKGYVLRYEEFHGDHSYLNWRDSMVAGLRYLLGDS